MSNAPKRLWFYIGWLIAEHALIRRAIAVWMAYNMGRLIQVLTDKIEAAEELTVVHSAIIGSILGITVAVLSWRYVAKDKV